MQSKKLQTDTTQAQKEILDLKIAAVKFEGMLYALPEYLVVHVDSSGNKLAESYMVTRNRKTYENPRVSHRYNQLVSSTTLYNIIKSHLEYVNRKLESLEREHGALEVSSDKLTQMAQTLNALKNPRSRRQTLFMVNPPWVRMSDNENDIYEEALSLVARTQIADVTFIRDQLSIGNAWAERILKRLEDEEHVSRLSNKALKRTVLITIEDMDKREVERNADK